MSFFCPVSAFQEDVLCGLASVAALAFVGIGLVDGVEVSAQANLAGAHLRDDGAYRSVCPDVRVEDGFPRPHTKSKEISTVFGRFPGLLPFVFHCSADDGLGCRC
jgi:hypothetical protein